MERQAFLTLTTSAQWLLFLAIGMIVFSWAERRKIIGQAGQILFCLLGIFSLWVILSKQITSPEVIPGQPIPAEADALVFFAGLVAAGIIGLAGFIIGLRKPRWATGVNVVLVLAALFFFFMVYNLQRQPPV